MGRLVLWPGYWLHRRNSGAGDASDRWSSGNGAGFERSGGCDYIRGAATGILAGGLIGALTGWGVPEEEAQVYEDSIRQGGILILVPAHFRDEEEVKAVLEDFGASQVKVVEHTEAHKYAQREKVSLQDRFSAGYFPVMGYKGGQVKDGGEEIIQKRLRKR